MDDKTNITINAEDNIEWPKNLPPTSKNPELQKML